MSFPRIALLLTYSILSASLHAQETPQEPNHFTFYVTQAKEQTQEYSNAAQAYLHAQYHDPELRAYLHEQWSCPAGYAGAATGILAMLASYKLLRAPFLKRLSPFVAAGFIGIELAERIRVKVNTLDADDIVDENTLAAVVEVIEEHDNEQEKNQNV